MAFAPTYAGVGDNKLDVYGATDVAMWTITFGASDTYVTGGLALVAATFGLSRPIAGVIVIGQNTAMEGILWVWNTTTQKLQAFVTGASSGAVLAELGSASSLIQSAAITVLIPTQR
jgi:hypothetical protein